MRTIKFRGTTFNRKIWAYGLIDMLRFDDDTWHYYIREYKQNGGYTDYEVDHNTIGQFTGLYDKNGKEIYEGDILKNNFSDVPFGVVTWHKDGYFFIDCEFGKFPIDANGYRPLGEMLVLKIDNVKDVTFEVIGNIHDKQEEEE